jgi:DNA-binding transcriptional ArsR family regulator/very-short-patch-repair endonuclease
MSANVHGLAARQGGHISREQLRRAGVSQATVTRWVGAGKLIRIHRGVYAVGHVQRNPINVAHAALLAGGDRSALAGACALVLWGLWRRWPHPLELVTADDRRPRGLVVHRATGLRRRDVRIVQGLRVTSPARTMLDMAPRLRPEQLTRAINDLRLRGLLTLDELCDVIEHNSTHRAVTLLRPHLEHAQPEPTRSELEDRFLPLLRKHVLPTPRINVHVGGYRVDAFLPEHRLVVELDGWEAHRSRHRFVEDRRQDFAILLATGIPTVRLPSDDVRDATMPVLGRLLAQRQPAGDGPSGDPHLARDAPSRRPHPAVLDRLLTYNQMVSGLLTTDDAFSDAQADRVFHALADSTRRDILVNAIQREQSVSALARRYEISLTAVQKHVKVLERASLVSKQRSGREQIVVANPDTVRRANALLEALEQLWIDRANRIAEILKEEAEG